MPYQINPFTKKLDFYKDSRALINDNGTGPTDIWSAEHIINELDAHEHFVNPRVVFKETFTGNGSDTIFVLTGAILNGSFTEGSWNPTRLLITFPVEITSTSNGSIYDSGNIFTRHRLQVVSFGSDGTVTLNYPPRDTESFFLWYWYEMQDADIIDDYMREDFVTEMEADTPAIASQVPVDSSDFSSMLTASDNDVQTALITLDQHQHPYPGIDYEEHRTMPQLTHEYDGSAYEEYTYSHGLISTCVLWESSLKQRKIREWIYTYNGIKVATETVIQYDAGEQEEERLYSVFGYTAGKVSSVTTTRTTP